jgi:hypothetical protein
MLEQVIRIAERLQRDMLTMIEIGSAAPLDKAGPENTLAELRRLMTSMTSSRSGGCTTPDPFILMGGGICSNGGWMPAGSSRPPSPPVPTEAEMIGIRSRWTTALRNIEAAVVRFDSGLLTWQAMHETLMAAASTATGTFPIRLPTGDTAQVRFVTRPGTNTATYSDAELIDALKAAATTSPDSARADALLSLAQRYAFTPDMVALYVAAANGIVSDPDRARVFAQPIRLKGK